MKKKFPYWAWASGFLLVALGFASVADGHREGLNHRACLQAFEANGMTLVAIGVSVILGAFVWYQTD